MRYAPSVQPWLDNDHLRLLHDALELQTLCSETFAPRSANAKFAQARSSKRAVLQFFVDPMHGSDANTGTMTSPFQTVFAGINSCRGQQNGCDVLLRGGTHYLNDTLQITDMHSGMRISAYNGEKAIVSGGRKIQGLTWTADTTQSGVFVTSLASFIDGLPRGVPALRHNGQRATLARFPNANPELDMFPVGYVTANTEWMKPAYHGQQCDPSKQCGFSDTEVIPATDAWHGMYQNWTIGHGGNCEKFDPPLGAFCSDKFYLLRQFPELHARAPSGIHGADHLPASPYRKVEGAVVHAWRPGHWYTWMFEIANVTPSVQVGHWTIHNNTNAVFGMVPAPKQSSGTVTYLGELSSFDACWRACNATAKCDSFAWHSENFPGWATQCYGISGHAWSAASQDGVVSGRGPHTEGGAYVFGSGGNQGSDGNDEGAEWFIEGVIEELDAPNEYFFDTETKLLHFKVNSTAPPASEIVVPTLANLFDIIGSQASPVRNVTIEGLTFTENRPTFMEPRGTPSGGDWALERQGAVRVEGSESTLIKDCVFKGLDTNAISINGYNRYVTVDKNEFVSLGQNAITSWGRADKNDGRSGNVPLYNTITNNFVHEIGFIQKQSSFYFQAETALATIHNNIVFNIPRAGINFNDGFGGGAEVANNLLFNTCRESGDHGAFNSWDRLPYITTMKDGSPSTVPRRNNVHNNFIVANYAADGGCLDNDDGSSYYDIHHNFCMYGGHKQNFDGHSKRSFGNIHVHPQVYGTKCIDEEAEGWGFGTSGPFGLPPKGYAEEYTDNVCILPKAGDPFIVSQGGDLQHRADFVNSMVLRNNTIFIPDGDANSDHCMG
eukprot:TRINITY_DN17128_c0_g1_i4.p1 TRINITY_DN17128_c0_g1~~TRINITY_DN17128_c0_g1_i4.p1  ORF type:complete len:907 (+),score=123.99 TRINITY_DN17128_c0_g1_i4:215-2722(+)